MSRRTAMDRPCGLGFPAWMVACECIDGDGRCDAACSLRATGGEHTMSATLLEKGKQKGYLLHDEIIAAFPNAEQDIESLDDFFSTLYEQGIDIVEQEPIVRPDPPARVQRSRSERVDDERLDSQQAAQIAADSVRLYLQE